MPHMTFDPGATFRKAGSGALSTGAINADNVILFGGGKLTVAANSGVSTIKTFSMPEYTVSPTTSPNTYVPTAATFDLTNNAMIVDYTGTSPLGTLTADPAPQPLIEYLLHRGYNGGNWLGTGLTSSSAAATAGSGHPTAIGYGEASAIFDFSSNPTATFLGNTVDSTAVLMRYTLAGDANMDGTVNGLDFNALANGFGTSAKWTSGDFDYSGSVDSSDFALLAENYGMTIGSAAAVPSASLGSVVPEPTSIGVIGLAALAFRRRRQAN
jgi:hypothetical protein